VGRSRKQKASPSPLRMMTVTRMGGQLKKKKHSVYLPLRPFVPACRFTIPLLRRFQGQGDHFCARQMLVRGTPIIAEGYHVQTRRSHQTPKDKGWAGSANASLP